MAPQETAEQKKLNKEISTLDKEIMSFTEKLNTTQYRIMHGFMRTYSYMIKAVRITENGIEEVPLIPTQVKEER